MLYALGDPLSLLVLAVSALVALTLSGWVSALAADRAGSPEVRAEQRLRPDPRRHLDPFGTIGLVLAGVGWSRPTAVPFRAGTGRAAAVTLLGPLACLAVGAGCLVAVGVLEGPLGTDTRALQLGIPAALPLLPRVLLLAGLVHLFVGLLALVPLPPLPGGQLLFARAPRTAGWQKAELYLVEKNLGTLAVLVLLLLPLGGQRPALLALLDAVGGPLVRLLTGA